MSSRDLVGRPLVPFFDADENVNDALVADARMGFESVDVDARVWNKELGYFEYPSDQTASSSDGSSAAPAPRRGKAASAPIAIQPRASSSAAATAPDAGGSFGSAGRVLLTPAMMLSSSCPTPSEPLAPLAGDAGTRSASAKRGSKADKAARSGTPARRRNKSKPEPSGGETATTAVTTTTSGGEPPAKDEKRKRGGRSKSKDGASTAAAAAKGASKEELSGGGKWAWSAFQSSPDPAQLPLPPFLGPQAQPDRPPQPTTPPEAAGATPPPTSIEESMTHDLRRMLNIGGG